MKVAVGLAEASRLAGGWPGEREQRPGLPAVAGLCGFRPRGRGPEAILVVGGSFLQRPGEGKSLRSSAWRRDLGLGMRKRSMGTGGPANKQRPVYPLAAPQTSRGRWSTWAPAGCSAAPAARRLL